MNKLFNKQTSIRKQLIIVQIILVAMITIPLFFGTYTLFTKYYNNTIELQAKETSRQIVYNYENYMSQVIDTMSMLQVYLNDTKSSKDFEDINEEFYYVCKYNQVIENISLYDINANCFASTETDTIGTTASPNTVWFNDALTNPTVNVFSRFYKAQDDNYNFSVSKYITYGDQNEPGILILDVDIQSMVLLFEKSNLGVNGHITLVNLNGDLVYSDVSDYSEELSLIEKDIIGNDTYIYNGSPMFLTIDTISNTGWRAAISIDLSTFSSIQSSFLLSMVGAIVAILVLSIALVKYLSNKITMPLKELELYMARVEQRDYIKYEEIRVMGNLEVYQLSKRLDKMMSKINDLSENIVFEHQAQRKSELKALQNQINPHFLYNTLDSILWLTENEKNDQASEMIIALAKLFRISISRGENIIPVKSELEHARNYLTIQNIRYQDSFDYEFIIDEQVYEYKTMKLILQPLIENSIYHGLKNNIDRGHITIKAYLENNLIVFSVTDNGYGMSEEKVEELLNNIKDPTINESVGLKNVYQRIRIYFGIQADISIKSEMDEGTTIYLVIPIGGELIE